MGKFSVAGRDAPYPPVGKTLHVYIYIYIYMFKHNYKTLYNNEF